MTARRWLFAAGLVAGLALAGAALVWLRPRPHTFAALVQNPPQPAPDITLTDETGQPFALSELRGQWVLLTFGYTTCPDVCPTTLARLRQARGQLGPAGSAVRVVLVSVDPERDTPAVLREYVAHFGADFKGLTGTPEQVAAAAAAWGVTYEKRPVESAAGYLMNHSAFVYLIDPAFQWRLSVPFGVGPDEIAADLTYLMQRPEAAP